MVFVKVYHSSMTLLGSFETLVDFCKNIRILRKLATCWLGTRLSIFRFVKSGMGSTYIVKSTFWNWAMWRKTHFLSMSSVSLISGIASLIQIVSTFVIIFSHYWLHFLIMCINCTHSTTPLFGWNWSSLLLLAIFHLT